jgi:hypothetical protein
VAFKVSKAWGFSGMRIIDDSNWSHAIQLGVLYQHATHASRGWFDSHDLINWLNANHNAILNALVTNYEITGEGKPAEDPVRTATRETGKFIERELGQVKIGEQESLRQFTLANGTHRNGVCLNSKWRIDAQSTAAAQRGIRH